MSEQNQRDFALLEQIRLGDQQAFRQLFDHYYKQLVVKAVYLLKDPNAAKDAAQEVFFQLWKNRSKMKIQDSVAGYLKRAVTNRSLNQIKSRKPFVEEEQIKLNVSKAASAQEELEAEDLQTAIQSGLDALPERCRAIFVLRRIEGHSLKEIAEKLEISPKTVENQITKALKVLKEYVAPILKNNSS